MVMRDAVDSAAPRFSLTETPREHSLWHLWLILIAQQRPIFSAVNKLSSVQGRTNRRSFTVPRFKP